MIPLKVIHNRWAISILLLGLAVFGVMSFGASSPLSAQSPEGLSLGPTDLPEGSQKMYAGYLKDNTISHPLHLADFPDSSGEQRKLSDPILYGYDEVYVYSAFVVDEAAVAVGNFVYSYPDPASVIHSADAYKQQILDSGGQHVGTYTTGKNIKGDLYYLKGGESDHVYWFIGSYENKLILGLGNGLESETTKTTLANAFDISAQ